MAIIKDMYSTLGRESILRNVTNNFSLSVNGNRIARDQYLAHVDYMRRASAMMRCRAVPVSVPTIIQPGPVCRPCPISNASSRRMGR